MSDWDTYLDNAMEHFFFGDEDEDDFEPADYHYTDSYDPDLEAKGARESA